MPLYTYEHPKTGERVDVVQTMKEPHVFKRDGVNWKRVFSIPQASIDTKIDAFSQAQFRDKTYNKKGTLGDALDRAKELGEQRKQKHGKFDPVQRKYFEDYSKRRGGKVHLAELKQHHEEAKKKLDTKVKEVFKKVGLD